MQLLGKDTDPLARAAQKLEGLGADIVDLNMGCPMPKITGKGKGAALMRDVPAAAASCTRCGPPCASPHRQDSRRLGR